MTDTPSRVHVDFYCSLNDGVCPHNFFDYTGEIHKCEGNVFFCDGVVRKHNGETWHHPCPIYAAMRDRGGLPVQ